MQLRNSSSRYGAITIALHWFTVVAVLAAWLLGTFGDDLPTGAPRAAALVGHIWAGLAMLGLLALRIPWRLFDRPLPLEATPLGAWLGVAAKLTHLALYALLLAVPVVGIVLQFARGGALSIFGLAVIHPPWIGDRAAVRLAKAIHVWLAHGLMIAAALHAVAALVHHWVLRDRTLARMLPGFGR